MTQNNKIPDGWKIKKLGDLMTITSCKRVHKSDWVDSGVPFYRAREIVALYNNEKIFPLFISEDLYKKNISLLGKIECDDLLVTGVGSIGIPYLVKNTDRFYFKDGNIIWFKNKNSINGYFLYLSFNTSYIKNQIRNMSGIGTVGTYTIENAKNTKIFFPPLKEQEKIAGILTIWENTIELLDRQIDLKNQQKKYLMQTLLTGNIRLSGFTAPWDEVKLGDICKIKKGKQLSNLDMFEFGKYPVLNGGQDFSGYTDKFNAEKNTIAISEGGNSCGFVSYIISDFWSGGHCYTIETKINKLFSYYILKFNEINIMRLRVGSGLPNIQKSTLEKFKIKIPTDIKEQEKIAEILTLADDEIFLLKKKKELIKQQKQYLMQTLLTGQIRV